MRSLYSQNIRDVLQSSTINELVSEYLSEGGRKLIFESLIILDEINFDFAVRLGRSINFRYCTFAGNLIFNHHFEAGKEFFFENCLFEGDFKVEGGKFKNVTINDCEFRNSLAFKNGEFGKLRLETGKYVEVSFLESKFDELMIGAYGFSTDIKNLFFNFSKLKGQVNLYRIACCQLELSGTIDVSNSVQISECLIKHFIISELVNNGRFSISVLKGFTSKTSYFKQAFSDQILGIVDDKKLLKAYDNNIFCVYKSVLNNAEFNLINFLHYSIFAIKESNLSQVVFTNITWPKKVFDYLPSNHPNFQLHFARSMSKKNLRHLFNKRGYIKERSRNIREVYRQMKNAVARQNDFISEQYFHALEMKAYDTSLSWKQDLWTKFIIKLSFWTSNFGQSFIKPIVSIIIVNGVLFYFLCLLNSISCYHSSFVDTFAEFLKLCNPLHKNEPELKGLPYIVDTLTRIFSSYFIYNIIRATRRFVR